MREEIKRVKGLTSNCPLLVFNQSSDGTTCLDDPLIKLKGVDNKKSKIL